MNRLKPQHLAYIMLTTTAFLLACNHVIGRSIEGEIPPIGLSFWRWLLGSLILLPWVLPRFKDSLTHYKSNFKILLFLALCMSGSTTLILVALNYTTATNTSLLNAIQPSLTVLFAGVLLIEPITRIKLLGIGLGIMGVGLMVSQGDPSMLLKLDFNKGDLIALLAMCGFAGYSITLRYASSQLNSNEKLFAIALLGTILILPFYVWEHINIQAVLITQNSIITVFTLALLVSVIGNKLWNAGIMRIGPSRASVFINLIPVFGAGLAVFWLGESLQYYHVIGGCLVCSGIGFVIRQDNK